MNIDLSGKTALVTGSTEGIGFAIAQGLAQAGATVIINGRTGAKVDAAVARIGGSARAWRRTSAPPPGMTNWSGPSRRRISW
jgi:NAD(P)-dependent dehydrogenase (short-subunit alcohol dehydrogenase family)